jgi:hypothetical protein
MAGDRTAPTGPTRLGRLGRVPPARAAWGAFGERCGRKTCGWCRPPPRRSEA